MERKKFFRNLVCVSFLALQLILAVLLTGAAHKTIQQQRVCRNGDTALAGFSFGANCDPEPVLRIAIISSYPPEACGIGEFTRDLYSKGLQHSAELDPRSPTKVEVGIIVVDAGVTRANRSDYGSEVTAVLRRHSAADYVMAADLLNRDFDVVNLQHEYGIFGGERGELILLLLKRLTIPVVTNFHTVLPEPSVQARAILTEIAHLSNMITVMLPSLCDHIRANYTGSEVQCHFMPHGVPLKEQGRAPPLDKYSIGSNKRIILSPGLLSPNKGIESMLQAMVRVTSAVPDALYVIVGRQHPGVQGVDYVGSIKKLTQTMGLESSVVFVTAYQTKEDLIGWISRADVVVAPYNDPTQISSGTLSMTIGLGRVAVSTAFPYAEWVCRSDNHMGHTDVRPCETVPFSDDISAPFAAALERILTSPKLQKRMQEAAYSHGRRAQWPRLAGEWVGMLRREAERGRRLGRSDSGNRGSSSSRLTKISEIDFPKRVWAEDLATAVLLGTKDAAAAAAALPRLESARARLRFAGMVAEPGGKCAADVGKSSFYATNGMSVFHGEVRKKDYVFLHTLPLRGLHLGNGVRYGGMFLLYRVREERVETRFLPDTWSVSCGDNADTIVEMRVALKDPEDETAVIGDVTMRFTLHGLTSVLTWDLTVNAIDVCLEDVEVQSAVEGLSILFPNLKFNRFYPKLATVTVPRPKDPVSGIELYHQNRDGLLTWDLLTNDGGEFGLITVVKNQTFLRYVTAHDPTDGNFHYMVHRYHADAICPEEPFIISEDKIVLRNIDVERVGELSLLIDQIDELVGIDVSGPENKSLVAQAFDTLTVSNSTDLAK